MRGIQGMSFLLGLTLNVSVALASGAEGVQTPLIQSPRWLRPIVLAPETPNQTAGTHTRGRLNSSQALPEDGPYHHHVYRFREHFYGTDGLVELLLQTAKRLHLHYKKHGIEPLQIGDLSERDGGNIPGHGSHENGLDVDIIYPRNNHQSEPLTATHMTELFVQNGRPTANFDGERTLDLIKILATSNRINHIYVDRILKRELCRISRTRGELEADTEVLRLLVPYPRHRDHLHVRLTCPSSSPACVRSRHVLPPGSGCTDRH